MWFGEECVRQAVGNQVSVQQLDEALNGLLSSRPGPGPEGVCQAEPGEALLSGGSSGLEF